MKSLFIINDPPYGTERVYNALRLAHALAKKDSRMEITVFLMADPHHQAIASRLVKEIVSMGGDVAPFVPAAQGASHTSQPHFPATLPSSHFEVRSASRMIVRLLGEEQQYRLHAPVHVGFL